MAGGLADGGAAGRLTRMKSGRASDTALLVARGVLLADATPALRELLPRDCATLTRRLVAAAAPAWWFDFALRHAWSRALLFAAERGSVPGLVAHFAARKCLLDRIAREALETGCRQIVVLGAGLDALAWRMQKHCACFEIDHPSSQEVKRRAFLADTADQPPELIAADLLTASPAAALRAHPCFDPRVPTLLVAEGLTMYLPAERVFNLLRECAGIAAPGSRFAFTFIEARPGQPPGFKNARPAVNRWLRKRGEPFTWALAREDAARFTAMHGWRLEWLSTELTIGESVALTILPA